MTTIERARRYVARMDPAVSGSGGHDATMWVAMVLVHGFRLGPDEAWEVMGEYNARCVPPWSDAELRHKLTSAAGSQPGRGADILARLAAQEGRRAARDAVKKRFAGAATATAKEGPTYDEGALQRMALADPVDAVWLANRSARDPAEVGSAQYLQSMYRPTERVLVFTEEKSQGQAVWPADPLPTTGRCGVWYLAQPVDGLYHANPRVLDDEGNPRPSRRSMESVTAWRWMVVESDRAPAGLWLRGLAALPLRIGAIYSSGGRSVHALVRLDAQSKEQWDRLKAAMAPALVRLGADPGALSAVRLTRLPGAWRGGGISGDRYSAYQAPRLQKLLYLSPDAPLRPLSDILPRRNVEQVWMDRGAALEREIAAAMLAPAAARAAALAACRARSGATVWGLRYYGPVRPALAALAERIEHALKVVANG